MTYHTYINYQSFAKRLATHHCLRAIPHAPPPFISLSATTLEAAIYRRSPNRDYRGFLKRARGYGGGGGLDGKKAHAHSRKPPRNKDAY